MSAVPVSVSEPMSEESIVYGRTSRFERPPSHTLLPQIVKRSDFWLTEGMTLFIVRNLYLERALGLNEFRYIVHEVREN